MRKYKTGYVAWKEDVKSNLEIVGKYFKIIFQTKKDGDGIKNGFYPIIITKNFSNARKVNQLIASSLSLLDACAVFTLDNIPQIIPLQDDGEKIPKLRLGYFESSMARIPDAIRIAAKASFKRKHFLSVLKYQLGCELHSNDLIDLYPQYYKLSKNPADHLRIANALIIFYSIIEELGFEVRANQKNPSKINGVWNPKIKIELENRLLNSNIKISENIDWALRSTPSKIERLKKPLIINKSDWARYDIRDSEIALIDAIAYAGWLRSKIAAHKLNDAFTSLSMYDLANVNFLVRRLLLESLGMFR